jgi:excisionase family DNA binding protein
VGLNKKYCKPTTEAIKWLSRKDACKFLGISMPTLNRYMQAGRIPFYKNGTAKSSRTRFLQQDLIKFLDKTKVN